MCIYDLYITIYACIYLYVRNILILILLLVRYYVSVRKTHTYEINGKKSRMMFRPLFHTPPRIPFLEHHVLIARFVCTACTYESIISENAPNVYCLPLVRRFVFGREICFYICTYRRKY